jgi:hypothetical protein
MSIVNEVQKEAKRVAEDANCSAKRHFDTSQFWEKTHYCIGIPSVALAAMAGASALSKWDYGAVVAGIISIVVAILTAVNTFINPSQRAEIHHKMGNAYLTLKNNARIFHNIQAHTLQSDTDLQVTLKEWTDKRNELNASAPQTPKRFYKSARKGIDDGESRYEVDE